MDILSGSTSISCSIVPYVPRGVPSSVQNHRISLTSQNVTHFLFLWCWLLAWDMQVDRWGRFFWIIQLQYRIRDVVPPTSTNDPRSDFFSFSWVVPPYVTYHCIQKPKITVLHNLKLIVYVCAQIISWYTFTSVWQNLSSSQIIEVGWVV